MDCEEQKAAADESAAANTTADSACETGAADDFSVQSAAADAIGHAGTDDSCAAVATTINPKQGDYHDEISVSCWN